MKDTTWDVRARTNGDGSSTVYARKHTFQVGAPLHFDTEYEHVTAVEYLLGAMGADLVGGLKLLARRQGLQVDDIEVTLSAKLNNPLTYLGVIGEEGHPGLNRVTATIYVNSVESEERLRLAWEETLKRSPLVNTLRPVVDLDLTLKVVL